MKKRNKFCLKNLSYESQKKWIRLREQVHDLYYVHKLSKRSISERLKVSLNFVLKWTKEGEMDFSIDNRGWKNGKGRKWTKNDLRRISEIHRQLSKNKDSFFCGATAIQQAWIKKYKTESPPLRTIGWMLKELGLSGALKEKTNKGAARYLCYPEHSIHHYAGKRVLEVDFIGKKFIKGQTAPIHFAAASFKYEPKLRYYEIVASESADCLMKFLRTVFVKFEKPDVVKMDNGFAMSGTAPQPRVLSKLPLWLLQQQVIPMYAVPRKPFSQASIEGNNSVFGRKFWNRFEFRNTTEIKKKLKLFNKASLQYYQYKPSSNSIKNKKKFIPKIFYLRQVREDEKEKAFIEVAHEKIPLPKTYLNYFVMAEWKLKTEKLTIFIEKNEKLKKIKTLSFKLNEKSKQKLFNKKQ